MPPVTNHARPIAVPRRSPSKGVKAISSAGSRIEDAASIRPKSASVAAAGDGKKLVKRRPIVSASLTDGNNGPHVDAQAVTNAIDTKPTVVTNGKKKINRSTALARVKPVMSTDGTCATIDGSAAALIEASGNDGPSPTKNTVEGKMPTKVAGSNARSDTKRVKPRPTITSVTSSVAPAISASETNGGKTIEDKKTPSPRPSPPNSRPKPIVTNAENNTKPDLYTSDDAVPTRPIRRRSNRLASRRPAPARPTAVNNNGSTVHQFGDRPLDLLMANHSATLITHLVKHATTGNKSSPCNKVGNVVTVSAGKIIII